MDKLRMQTANKADENFRKLAAMFPNAVTETITGYDENGKAIVERAIDKDVLMQEISCTVVDGNEERYQFTWPDKKKSVLLANAPISKTLRPVRDNETVPTGADSDGKPYCSTGSVDFDTTENLYIEGDNLEVLKLLQETYLGKVKMIYIDPPYNTGNDFVYEDDFAQSTDEYLANSGQFDENGNRLVPNTESNGRFHTDWLNMIYPRLRLTKDLLTDDGVVFISIDENEMENLRKVCDEIFGESNFIGQFVWQRRTSPDMRKLVSTAHDYIVTYGKNTENLPNAINKVRLTEKDTSNYSNPDNDPRGPWASSDFTAQGFRPNQMYEIVTPGGAKYTPPEGRCWKNIESEFLKQCAEGRMWFGRDGMGIPRRKTYLSEREGKNVWTWWPNSEVGHSQEATQEVKNLFDGHAYFDYPKPVRLLKKIIQIGTHEDSLLLDFFSGSATTAHAVMQLNAEDGGHRKFIMVQLPEATDEKSEAYKAGYKNICEIGKERIRRAGKKIQEERLEAIALSKHEWDQTCFYVEHKEECDRLGHLPDEYFAKEHPPIDTGFRVLKCDTSNMKEVYYNPAEYEANMFSSLEDNIKEDRTPEDLLFQVMLDLGILLSSKIQVRSEKVGMRSYSYFDVEDGYLIACFDKNIDEEVITAIAKQKPYYFVMRDSSMANDSVATNFDQIFATYSPDTVRKVL